MYIKRRQRALIAVALVALVAIIAAGAYVFMVYKPVPKQPVEQQVPQTDDRISPYANQGLVVEVNRIRNRDIVNRLMARGTSWRDKPQFYFTSDVDGLLYISKDVAATAGASNEQLFVTWDSWFQENKVIYDTPDGQEKSDVTLTIVERVPSGILGRRSEDITKETIVLSYDFKTGRWSGDDSQNDSDGYGHYLGDAYEVWFNLYQTDNDEDGIPFWTEVNVLRTDANFSDAELDPDEDGIPTYWEWRWGYNPLVYENHSALDPDRDGLNNAEEYQMARYFANPFHQDVYLEVDGMQSGSFTDEDHLLYPESAQLMTERYAQHNICFYVDNGWPDGPSNGGGQLVPYYNVISQDSGMMLQFYDHYFPVERHGIFRYAIVANKAGFCHPSEFNMYDSMAVSTDYNLQFKILRRSFTERTKILAQVSELMHEIGHTMGIRRENYAGCDNFTYTQGKAAKQVFLDTWGNYRSVMNYYYFWDYSVVDYSSGTNGPGDRDDWAWIMNNMSYFNEEALEIEQPPEPVTEFFGADYDGVRAGFLRTVLLSR